MWEMTIGILGAALSGIGAYFSLKSAQRAASIRDTMASDYRRLVLSDVSQKLSYLQTELNKIEAYERGFSLTPSLRDVRRHLDDVLNALVADGGDTDLRQHVLRIQKGFANVNVFERNNPDRGQVIQQIRVSLQECISMAKSRSFLQVPTQ